MQYVQVRTADAVRRLEIPNEVVAAGPVAVASFVANPPAFAVYVDPIADDASDSPATTTVTEPAKTDADRWLIEQGFVDLPDVIHLMDPSEPPVTRAPRRAPNVDHPVIRPSPTDATPQEG